VVAPHPLQLLLGEKGGGHALAIRARLPHRRDRERHRRRRRERKERERGEHLEHGEAAPTPPRRPHSGATWPDGHTVTLRVCPVDASLNTRVVAAPGRMSMPRVLNSKVLPAPATRVTLRGSVR